MSANEDQKNAEHRAAMQALKAEREALMATKTDEAPGLLLVHTGDGKGKSTAAFGMVARALGWNQKVGIVQYIKGKWITGERQFFKRFPDQVRYEVMGEGFTWETQDRARDIAAAEAAWATSVEMLHDPQLELVLLDEHGLRLIVQKALLRHENRPLSFSRALPATSAAVLLRTSLTLK